MVIAENNQLRGREVRVKAWWWGRRVKSMAGRENCMNKIAENDECLRELPTPLPECFDI